MNEKTRQQSAEQRIDEMNFSEAELEFIWADWPNWDEHISWLLSASREEIANWIQTEEV